MNQRNVDVLTEILRRAVDPELPVDGHLPEYGVKDLAVYLASCGVLVPSALTDEEANHVSTESERVADAQNPERTWEQKTTTTAAAVRVLLDLIAKGKDGA